MDILHWKSKKQKFPLLFKMYCEDIKTILQEDSTLYDEDWFLREFNDRFDKITIFFQEHLEKNGEENTVTLLVNFLRKIKKLLGINIFYNLTPNISYKDYIQKSLWEQLLNNIFNNQIYIYKDCLIKKEFIQWGSCHHRNIFFKNFCDIIKIPNLKTTIIQKPNWHSFLKLEYWATTYLSDIIQGYPIMDNKQIIKFGDINHFNSLDIENSDLFDFEDIDHFIHHFKNKTYTKIHLEINRIKLLIDRHDLYFQINEKEVKYNNTYTKIPNTVHSQEEIFQLLIPNRKYLIPHLAHKINFDVLKAIVCKKEA